MKTNNIDWSNNSKNFTQRLYLKVENIRIFPIPLRMVYLFIHLFVCWQYIFKVCQDLYTSPLQQAPHLHTPVSLYS